MGGGHNRSNGSNGLGGGSSEPAEGGSRLTSVESLDKGNEMARGLNNRHVQFLSLIHI